MVVKAQLFRRLGRVSLGAVLVTACAGLAGCAEDEDLAAGTEVELPDIRGPGDLADIYIGALDEDFRGDLDVYTDVEVTLLATVEEALSPRAFTATAPDGAEVEPVLVVTAGRAAEMEPGDGEEWIIAATPLEDFHAGTVADELGIQLPEDRFEEWDGETFLVATVLEEAG